MSLKNDLIDLDSALVVNGLFNVRSLWKQSGVRVGSAGHVRFRGGAAKILHDLYPPPSNPKCLSSSGVAATAMPVSWNMQRFLEFKVATQKTFTLCSTSPARLGISVAQLKNPSTSVARLGIQDAPRKTPTRSVARLQIVI